MSAEESEHKKVVVVDENDNVIGAEYMFDAIEKKMLRKVSRVFVFDQQGKILVQRRSASVVRPLLLDQSVGGHVDEGETYYEAAERELMEELGLKVKSIKYIGSAPNTYVFSEFSVFTLDMAFIVIPESIKGLKPMDDILDYKFYSERELNYEDIPAPSIKKFVKDYFRNE